jgi:hypothetical protein
MLLFLFENFSLKFQYISTLVEVVSSKLSIKNTDGIFKYLFWDCDQKVLCKFNSKPMMFEPMNCSRIWWLFNDPWYTITSLPSTIS